MIRSITITNYIGDTIELKLANPEESGFIVTSIDGLGPGTATINSTEITTNDGGIFNSSRLSSRNIVISLQFLWKDTIEDVRHLSYTYFPVKKKLTLLVETDTRKAEIEGYVESNEPDIFNSDETAEISIICPYPYFYAAGEYSTNVTEFGGVQAMFEFPFSNESLEDKLIIFGEILTLAEKTVVYTGDAEVGVTITIHALGPASNITIYDIDTQEAMYIDTSKIESITGASFSTGDDIIISTVKGSKSISLLRDGVYTNILNCLGKDVSWFLLAKGNNQFAVTAESGLYNLRITIENRILYEGV